MTPDRIGVEREMPSLTLRRRKDWRCQGEVIDLTLSTDFDGDPDPDSDSEGSTYHSPLVPYHLILNP